MIKVIIINQCISDNDYAIYQFLLALKHQHFYFNFAAYLGSVDGVVGSTLYRGQEIMEA